MEVIVYVISSPSERTAVDAGMAEWLAREVGSRINWKWSGQVETARAILPDHEASPLDVHLGAWKVSLEGSDLTRKHVELFTSRARRVVALLMGAKLEEIEPAKNANRAAIAVAAAALSRAIVPARLSHLTAEAVQGAVAALRQRGRSAQTCNHHRAAIRAFSKWAKASGLIGEDRLRAVKGFKTQGDRRHDRRVISLEELRRLVDCASHGPEVLGVSGRARAMCYRVAVATGLRYGELACITRASIGDKGLSIALDASETKNGQNARLPLPRELGDDLGAFLEGLPPGKPIFPLPEEKGANMLRVDLKAAGIPYRDDSGRFFDFHSLRCETATLADAAGVSPRVVQRLMRHSSLELTGRYTRPRDEELDAAAEMIPSLRPVVD